MNSSRHPGRLRPVDTTGRLSPDGEGRRDVEVTQTVAQAPEPDRMPYSCHAQFGNPAAVAGAGGGTTVCGIARSMSHSSMLTIVQTIMRRRWERQSRAIDDSGIRQRWRGRVGTMGSSRGGEDADRGGCRCSVGRRVDPATCVTDANCHRHAAVTSRVERITRGQPVGDSVDCQVERSFEHRPSSSPSWVMAHRFRAGLEDVDLPLQQMTSPRAIRACSVISPWLPGPARGGWADPHGAGRPHGHRHSKAPPARLGSCPARWPADAAC